MDKSVLALAFAFVLVFGGFVYVNLKGDGVGVPGVAVGPSSVTTFTQGGGITSTSSAGASSILLATDFDTENVVRIQPTGANHTLTLPASTSFPGIPFPGDSRDIVIENAATAATTTTIAAGTGVDLQEPDGQNVVIGQNNYAFLTCYREASTDVVCRVDETIPAD